MENTKNFTTLWVVLGVLVALIAGGVAGYYYGNSVGIKNGKIIGSYEGRTALLDEQAKIETAKLKAIQSAANPFAEQQSAANPFKSATTYVNPFAQ
jgi:hypothetical protein